MFNEDTYENDIKDFEKVSSSKADELLSGDDLTIVYIGRATCPYCRRFAKKLGSLTNEISSTIYYINSENFSDDNIGAFREKYNVPTVPGFIVNKNGNVSVRCDSSMSEDEILEMA